MAKHLIGSGCRECNHDIAVAEVRATISPVFVGVHEFVRLTKQGRQPRVLLDGEDMTGREVVFCAPNRGTGLLVRNATDARLPRYDRHGQPISQAVLCDCGSELIKVELWEGDVIFVFADDVILHDPRLLFDL